MVWQARMRLASLWLSQVARVMADNALRFFVVLDLAARSEAERGSAWYLVTALLMLPAVALAPLNGPLGNSLPKPWVLVGSAAFGLAVTAAFTAAGAGWVAGWALVAVGSAVYGPVRYALLPAGAEDGRVALTRLNGFFEAGAAA